MLEIFDEKFKPEYTTTSKEFQDGTQSKDELIPQSDVFVDNMACMKFAHTPKLSPRIKHMADLLHWYRLKVINLVIVIKSVPSALQLSDQFIKGMGKEPFEPSRILDQ
jgi:hypothetical protein